MGAVAACNLEKVRDSLTMGADPNYTVFRDDEEPDGYIQPTTPLRMVMFRISDALLENKSLLDLAEIAKVLLDHGADPKPAMLLAEDRYGKYNPNADNTPFMNVWKIVANAMNGQ